MQLESFASVYLKLATSLVEECIQFNESKDDFDGEENNEDIATCMKHAKRSQSCFTFAPLSWKLFAHSIFFNAGCNSI